MAPEMAPTGRPPDGTIADDPAAAASPRPLEAGLGFRLGRAHRVVRSAWEARITDLELSGAQAGVLRAVVEQPGMGLRELARRLGTDPMNAKRLADGLQRAGLLASEDDPADRRRRELHPTDAGLVLGRQVALRGAEWSRTLERILGREDASRLWQILERIEDGIAGLPDPAAGHAEEA
jgi:DNA-binding MarR family transcriptional regulator